MNHHDLNQLDRLLQLADRVVPMRDIWKGDTSPKVIGMRHDVDDNQGSFATALRMAQWEHDQGYSSTYYLLHDAHYWDDEMLVLACEFEELGHEVGLHVNAIAQALRTGRQPRQILEQALADLRTAARVEGCVAHGDPWCRNKLTGEVVFVNDEIFTETPRPDLGSAHRVVVRGRRRMELHPFPRASLGLLYDANWLPRGNYLSDSGGIWSQSIAGVTQTFGHGQLHMLVHPDWWASAFAKVAA